MATMKKAQSGAKTTKKPKTASQRIGDLTLRDVKNSAETATNILTLGGYGAAKKGIKKLINKKSGGIITAAKGKAKNGKTMKKAQDGVNTLLPGGYAPKSREERYNNYPTSKPKPKAKPKSSIQKATPQEIEKYGMLGTRNAKSGAKMKKCKTGCK